jgi:hypothetical protein
MNRLVLGILVATLGTPGFAQEPALGRLFLTPEQRAALDNARRNKIRAQALATTVDKKPKVPPARSVTINGIVSRSDGESTIWVNGEPTEGRTEDGMRVTVSPGSQSSVVLREPEKGKQVRLKVGQRADLVSGRIQEPYEQRRTQGAPPVSSEPAKAEHASTARGNRHPDGSTVNAGRSERDSEQQTTEQPERDDAGDQRGDH